MRGKKSAGGRDDAAMSDQERFRSNRFLKAVFARAARGVVSMEEGFPGKKVRPFLVVMRNFRGGKGRNGEIFIQFSDAFFVRFKEFFSRERGLECINERTDVRGLERSCLYKNRKKRGGEGGGESVGVRVYYYRWL